MPLVVRLQHGVGACHVLYNPQNAPSVLFDTGADSLTLIYNMKKLGIDVEHSGVLVTVSFWDSLSQLHRESGALRSRKQ